MSDVKESLDAIKEVTEDINETYLYLRKIQKVLDVAAVAVLASSIVSREPELIAKSIGELVTT
jgi:hypothetical protein